MPNVQERRWSVEDVWALPDDGNRHETVDGELLVSPAPKVKHQVVGGAVYRALFEWVRQGGIGVTLFAPTDVILDPHTLVQPDILVLPPIGRDVTEGDVAVPTPLLVIEVLSPGTARNDRLKKRPRFQRAGIECWLVDIDSQLVERWAPDADRPEICVEAVRWIPAGAHEEFELRLAPVWEEVGLPVIESE
ncbi:Uma2 family endonuclease [Gemmatimonas aurantiaca]|uniref:Uma2 family endonuclease n=1 Tax=Gemmatimonas aurantiaca TaxID=173480 RepID=UPI00301C62F6